MAKENQMNNTEFELKELTKTIGAALKRQQHEVPHSVLLHAVGAALGKRDWHKLKEALANTNVSEAPALAKPVAPQVEAPLELPNFAQTTLFYLRMAYALGRPDGVVLRSEAQVLEAAKTAIGTLSGKLWLPGGPQVTATFGDDGRTLHCAHTPERFTSAYFVIDTKVGTVSMGARFDEAGWHLTTEGFEQGYSELVDSIPDSLILGTQGLPGPMVFAKLTIDDQVFRVPFDAQRYFMQASDDVLRDLWNISFSGDYHADNVAEFYNSTVLNPDIGQAFDYLHARRRGEMGDEIGFEVAVDSEMYFRWMDAHRKASLARYLCQDYGVTFNHEGYPCDVEWTWQQTTGKGTRQAGRFFASRREAELDAYKTLNLLDLVIEENKENGNNLFL